MGCPPRLSGEGVSGWGERGSKRMSERVDGGEVVRG